MKHITKQTVYLTVNNDSETVIYCENIGKIEKCNGYFFTSEQLNEYTELLLKEAADKALINPLNHDGYSYGSQDTIYIEPNENSDYFNFGGTCVVDKESITSIINDINFD